MSGLQPTARTNEAQARAANPALSAFVSANAGSGKTHVLVQRVIRLLLDGVPPDHILCLTFTKAAAAQMHGKVAERLGHWAILDDAALAAEVGKLIGSPPAPALLVRARRLFAEALETPGGLKIQTIHAFCERLIQQFPFEANVPAGFAVLDERDAAALRVTARHAVFASLGPRGKLAGAMADLIAEGCERRLPELLDAAIYRASDFRRLFRDPDTDSAEKAAAELARQLGIAPGTSPDTVDAEILRDGLLAGDWREIAGWLEGGSKTDKDDAANLIAGAVGAPAARVSSYLKALLTSKFIRRSRPPGTIGLRKPRPDLGAAIDAEIDRVTALLEQKKAASTLRRTAALYRIAEPVLQAFAHAKAQRGALDYEDLIARTSDLLSRTDASWVLFKIDGGIDHMLIDEAQDTSPDAWRIIEALSADFTAGHGARAGVRRTLFAVGDEKQSIYSFQGAVPAEFGRMQVAFERAHVAARLHFERIQLTQSFRSTQTVLSAVDNVFSLPTAYAGLESLEPRPTAHETARPGAPGIVELWPLVKPPPEDEREDLPWDAPFDRREATSPVVQLGKRIAGFVRAEVGKGLPPGEVLILVRKRGPVFESVLRALKEAGVPVAGADRLVVNEHIAVMDLLALGNALVSPDDDLSLATALKSPLFGLDDSDLIHLATVREGQRLRDALAERASTTAQRSALAQFEAWDSQAKMLSPFAFYAGVLGASGMRRAFRARLGAEADDALDAFLESADAYGAANPPTLAGFLAWVGAARTEIKRDLDVGGNEVRVMTVHGAKGLEAELVILADSCTAPLGGPKSALGMLPRANVPDNSPPLPVWMPAKADMPAPLVASVAKDNEAQHEEQRRLLYVALTRAKDRLVVAGHQGGRALPAGCWYGHVKAGLEAHAEPVPVDGWEEPMLRIGAVDLPLAAGHSPETMTPDLPAWAMVAPAFEAPAEAGAAASSLRSGGKRQALTGARLLAAERGDLLHRLLEKLPAADPVRCAEIAPLIAARAIALPEEMRAACIASALAILRDPVFARLFTPEARVEVPIRGRMPVSGKLINGRIDRLLVRDGEVLVVDYKTDSRPPEPGDPVPISYAAQFAAYRALLRQIYPAHAVRCALLWTRVPRLDVIPDTVLDAAEQEICSGVGAASRTGAPGGPALDDALSPP